MNVISSLRQPAYTGPNRCWPCTAVNVLIVVALTVLAGVRNPLLGLLVLATGAVGIALRGYVIPYTPTVAPHIVDAIPGVNRLFPVHERDQTRGGIADPDAGGEQVLTVLIEAGILVGNEELELAETFEFDWWNAINDIADMTTEALAPLVEEASPTPVRARILEEDGRQFIILTDDTNSIQSETWLSRPVAIADVAAVRVLAEHDIDDQMAANAAAPLRLFLDECPDCRGGIVEQSADGCCGGPGPGGPNTVLACEHCRQRLATLE